MNLTKELAPDDLRVSLVIPVRDEAETVRELIESIQKQTRRPDEIVFVDGGSRDRTVELLREACQQDKTLRLVEAGVATPGRGRNIGVAESRSDWIAFTDAGNRLEPRWLEYLLEAVRRDPSVAIVFGNYEPIRNSFFTRCAALAYVPAKQQRPGGIMRGPFIASSLVRRDVLQTVGGFPDRRAAEDLMFFEAIEQQGLASGWAPAATTWWHLQPDFLHTFKRFMLYSRHNVWAGRQGFWHYGVARQYLFAAVFVLLAVAHSPWWLVGPVLGMVLRAGKSIWRRREDRGLLWAINPAQFLWVILILLTVDLATFVGWAQALGPRPNNEGQGVPQDQQRV